MDHTEREDVLKKLVSALSLTAVLVALPAMAAPLIVPDNGQGTINLPPPGDYVTPADVHVDISGRARGDARHRGFVVDQVGPGGILGGEIEIFGSVLDIHFTGEGPLEGWSRTVSVPVRSETHTAPRDAGKEVQSFDTHMYRLEGELTGDKDFESLSIVAGTGNGLESPGHTTLYRQPDGSFLVDSHFNIKFTGSFKGAAGGVFDGIEDSFGGVITVTAVAPGSQK